MLGLPHETDAMRKLASVQRVLALEPIKNADFIELAQINGWQCIVRKGEFKVGDLGVYLEIDAVPPNTPAFEFLWKPRPEPPPTLRIRTKKLKGVISQGLLLPLTSFTEAGPALFVEGQDVTEQLGVKKYEVPVKGPRSHAKRVMYGPFAADIPKTDEERIQSSPGLLDELRGLPYVITEKCDGTSATFSIDRDGVFRVYSRNWEIEPAKQPGRLEAFFLAAVRWLALLLLKRRAGLGNKLRLWVHQRQHRKETLYWDVARKYNIETALRAYPDWALQGEICGPGIQKNRLGLKENELRAFTLYDKKTGKREPYGVFSDFCVHNNIPKCRMVENGLSFAHTLPSLLTFAEGKYEGTANEREGIVVRPLLHTHSRILGGALSFKVISNKFLLTGGEDE